MEYTVVVNAPASEPAPFKYLAPYAGCAMGQHWMENGEHALDRLRRPVQAGRGLPAAVAAAAPAARARGLSRRRVLPAQPPARAGGQAVGRPWAAGRSPLCRSSRPRPATSRPTSRPTSSRSPMARCSSSRTSSIRASGRPSTSATRCHASAAPPRSRPCGRWPGTLKTDLAQFRDLEAFAAFGSELDKVSQAQLDRGYRLTEVLKQPQNAPVPVEEQVLAIYAATNGSSTTSPSRDVRRFESRADRIRRSPATPTCSRRSGRPRCCPTRTKLDAAIGEFKKLFAPERERRRVEGVDARMAGGQERVLRRRIRSVESTKKITRAMELIAASRIVRAQQAIAAARPYVAKMGEVVDAPGGHARRRRPSALPGGRDGAEGGDRR